MNEVYSLNHFPSFSGRNSLSEISVDIHEMTSTFLMWDGDNTPSSLLSIWGSLEIPLILSLTDLRVAFE